MFSVDKSISIAALVSAAISITGWYVSYLLSKAKDKEIRQTEMEIKLIQRQIEEVYGPLYGLIELVNTIRKIRDERLDLIKKPSVSDEIQRQQRKEVKTFFTEKYFLRLNGEMANIIRSKTYLISGFEVNGKLPDYFELFLKHEAYYNSLHNLWKDTNLDSRDIPGYGWPNEFEEVVRSKLHELTQEYFGKFKKIERYGYKSKLKNTKVKEYMDHDLENISDL